MHFIHRQSFHTRFPKGFCTLLVVFTCSLFDYAVSDFRFCSKGPQIIKDTDCPGGFIMKDPVPTACSYYALSNQVPDGTSAQVVENYCTPGDPVDLPVTGDKVAIQEVGQFEVMLGDTEGSPATPGKTPSNVCITECLGDWQDPEALYPEDHLVDKPDVLPNDTETAERERSLTKKLFTSVIMDGSFDDDEGAPPADDIFLYKATSNGSQPRSMKLLAKSMQVVRAQCNPFVEINFLRSVLKAMDYLNRHQRKPMQEIGQEEFRRIEGLLDQCIDDPNEDFKLIGPQCDSYYRINAIAYLERNEIWRYRPKSRSFIWGMYDPIVEAAWAVVDFVHGYCFKTFIHDVNHHHMYMSAMEGLFPKDPVQQHWMNPTSFGKSDDVLWNSVLETANIKIAMNNLDACVLAGYADAPFKHRLNRPFATEDRLDDPDYEPVVTTTTLGWLKGPEAYTDYYKAKGGFPYFAKKWDWGYCLPAPVGDDDKKSKIILDIKMKCNETEQDSVDPDVLPSYVGGDDDNVNTEDVDAGDDNNDER